MVVHKISTGLKAPFQSKILTTGSKTSDNANIYVAKSWIELKSLPIAPLIIIKLWQALPRTDILCAHYPFPLIDLALTLYPLKKPKIVVYWHSEVVSQKYLQYIVRPFTRRMLRMADKIIVAAPDIAQHSKMLAPYCNKIEVIPFGMDIPKKTNIQTPPEPHYLAVGRHVEYKGYNTLIESLSHTDLRLKIIGRGPLINEHKARAQKLGVLDRIEFIENACDQELDGYIQKCYALVFPSILPSEAFGLVQIEAMRHGKPIINTALKSGVPWVARDGLEAITVQAKNIDELSEAMIELSINEDLYAKLSNGAYQRFCNVFTSDVFLKKTSDCYNSILS